MTVEENLLVIAMEECAEIQQELAKVLRFGTGNHHPDDPNITNGMRVLKEYAQLQAVVNMLVWKRVLPPIDERKSSKIYHDKLDSVEKWEEYSRSIGRIN